MSVEHAPQGKRGFFGAFPQIGVPLGMILATATVLIINLMIGPEAYLAYGWRIPFLLSIFLIAVGYYIRKSVDESPVFKQMQALKSEESAPLKLLFKTNTKEVLLAALIFIANNAAGYLVIAFIASYTTKALGMSRNESLTASLIGGFGWFTFTMIGGWMSDRVGRVRTFQIGYGLMVLWAIPMWLLIDTGNLFLIIISVLVLTLALGLSYGPQSALYAEMFPAKVRYSGISIGYAIGSIFGGAFAPMIAQLLLDKTGHSWSIGVYIALAAVISLAAVSVVPKGIQDINLHPEEAHHES